MHLKKIPINCNIKFAEWCYFFHDADISVYTIQYHYNQYVPFFTTFFHSSIFYLPYFIYHSSVRNNNNNDNNGLTPVWNSAPVFTLILMYTSTVRAREWKVSLRYTVNYGRTHTLLLLCGYLPTGAQEPINDSQSMVPHTTESATYTVDSRQ